MLHLKLVRNTQLLCGEKLEALKHCQRRQQFIDLILICGENFYFAHKLILASVSTKSRYLILDSNSNQVSNIFLAGVKPQDVENLICLLYSGEIWLPRNEIPGLVKVATSLGVDQFAPHPDIEIPEELLQASVSNQTLRQPLKHSLKTSNGSRSRQNSGSKVPDVSKSDQENRDAESSSSNYTSFSDSLSTLPSSIGGSSYLHTSRTFGTTKQSKSSAFSSNQSSRPENLRREESDVFNMNLLAIEDSENEFGNDNGGDFTFNLPSPEAWSVCKRTRQCQGVPKCVSTPAHGKAVEMDSDTSGGNSFPDDTSIWNVTPAAANNSSGSLKSNMSVGLRRQTRFDAKNASTGIDSISNPLNKKPCKKIPSKPTKGTKPSSPALAPVRGNRAAKVKALNVIQTRARKAELKRNRL